MRNFELHGASVGPAAIALAILASVGGAIFGYDTGQIADIVVMNDFKQRFGEEQPDGSYEFSNVREGLIVAMLSIGTLIGALCGAPLADKYGRRKAMQIDCVIFSIGVVIQCTAFTAWEQVMIGRLIAGLGVGALSAAVPAYQSETAPKEIRGTLVATYQWLITAGILLSYCICIGTRYIGGRDQVGSLPSAQWRLPMALGILLALILGVGMQFMPESPRWLMFQGRHDEAAAALARVRGLSGQLDHPLVQRDYAEIEQSVQEQLERDREREERLGKPSKIAPWLECFQPRRKILYRTILGMTLQSLQQLTGANYFFYYGATIFQSVGLSDSFVTQIILGAINWFCTIFGLFLMEYAGRRWPLIIGGIWQSLWLFVFASIGVTRDPNSQETGRILIASAAMFILGYASTWGPGVWILIGETFPSKTRAKQGALSTASNWMWNFLIAFFTPYITSAIAFGYGYVFAGCNLAGALIVYLFLYESSGLSLEAVDIMYNDPKCRPWTSEKWAPPGYSSRKELEKTTHTSEDRHSLETRKRMDEKAVGMGSGNEKRVEEVDGKPNGHGMQNGNGTTGNGVTRHPTADHSDDGTMV